jgi:hypothetical protein
MPQQPTTEAWALSHGISIAPILPTIADYHEPCPFTARQVATRAIILQGVSAVASNVDPVPVVEWFREQGVWESVTPKEQSLLLAPSSIAKNELIAFQWQIEAEWALLWVVGKVDVLGLPTRQCESRRLVDEIIPALGSDIAPFLASGELRSPGALLAEDDRHYDLWCRYYQDRRGGAHLLPSDLAFDVLYQRVYVFEWLHGIEAWDDVTCDA